ncbi:hypothetical protein GCM10010260_36550 [Streptomyces filipinensis]|uniref:Uncharacterized protein n=1 Tax=Streptomyces filipinensis TaxID=66887 RepID=A0A918MAW1_9ACTN|nr:hypothetical protein GCM10010260_36550 [Streptomyces filipinensis]
MIAGLAVLRPARAKRERGGAPRRAGTAPTRAVPLREHHTPQQNPERLSGAKRRVSGAVGAGDAISAAV